MLIKKSWKYALYALAKIELNVKFFLIEHNTQTIPYTIIALVETNPLIKKTDYIKKAKMDAEIGYLGEMFVLEYERQRLVNNPLLSEYSDKIEHVSVKSDGYGYDIESYDLFGLEIKKIYIEVKTTKNKVDIEFPVSKGEVDRSKQLKKQYFVYRVYDVLKEPKFYRVSGSINDHFDLDPTTFLAKYKG